MPAVGVSGESVHVAICGAWVEANFLLSCDFLHLLRRKHVNNRCESNDLKYLILYI